MSSMKKLMESLDAIEPSNLKEYGSDVRQWTNKIHEAMEEGTMDPMDVASAALQYLSEDSVQDMARANDWVDVLGFGYEDDEDEDEDEDDFDAERYL